MTKQAKHLKVAPGTELANVLEEAEREGAPVILEKDGIMYRVTPEADDAVTPENLWRNYDAGKVLAALREVRGLWKGLDIDEFIEVTYATRHSPGRRPDIEL